MPQSDITASYKEKINTLEEEVLLLEVENHTLEQKIKNFEFDQHKLKEIQRLAKAGSWELNHLSYTLKISEELSQILYSESTHTANISWHDFLEMISISEDTDIKKQLLENVIQNGESLIFEHPLLRPDGRAIFVRQHCKTFYNSIGQPLISVGMILDITDEHSYSLELKQKNKELEIAKKEAVLANESKSSFLANMSHEIRTPMNAILGFVDILAKGEKEEKRQNYFKIIQESSKSLLTIINDILDISKIQSEKLITEKLPVKTKDLFQNSALMFESTFKDKDIDFDCMISATVPDMFIGDSTRIKQILFNLLNNAIKFTDSHGTVSLDVKYDYETQFLNVSVSDSGIGIAPENISKIFNAFEQEDSSTTRKFGGTGLGLTICSKLIAIMGGELKVDSILGQGSKFYFSIPAPQYLSEQENKESDILTKDKEEQKLSGKILLVDDIDVNQIVLGVYLDDLGLEYDIANNGLEALEMFKSKPYDVILMDEQMPVMSGIEATEKIRHYEKEQGSGHIQIVAVTANALAEDRKRLMDAGMDDYLSKPIDVDKLERVLRELLE